MSAPRMKLRPRPAGPTPTPRAETTHHIITGDYPRLEATATNSRLESGEKRETTTNESILTSSRL
jgi:hypothetical protein